MKSCARTLILAAACLLLVTAQVYAANSYYSRTDPGTTRPDAGAPWQMIPPGGGVGFPTTHNACIWIGKTNYHIAHNTKSYTMTLGGADAQKYDVQAATGYVNGNPPSANAGNTQTTDLPGGGRMITVSFTPQPDWEVLKICRVEKSASFKATTNVTVFAESHCSLTTTTTVYVDFNTASFSVMDDNPIWVTEVLVFADDQPAAPADMQVFVGPPDSGNWFSEIVYEDPDGEPRPLGGVRWFTDGPGLAPQEIYFQRFVMEGPASAHYSLYALDAETGMYMYFSIVPESLDPDETDPGDPEDDPLPLK